MATLLGSLLVSLGLDSGEFKSGLGQAEKDLRRTEARIRKSGEGMANLGRNMALGITLPLVALGVAAVKGAKEQAAAVAQVEAALRSMGNASGKTAAELAKTADALEMRSLFDADVILTKVTANLLTFGNVANEQFDRAQQAAIDMATRLGSDPQSAAIMLGKALNDPIKGITALTRVGVQFTDAQKKQIKAFADTGQAAKAQNVILAEVERQFRGAAQAAADTSPLRQAEVAWNQAMDKIGEAVLPLLPVIADAISGIAEAFNSLSPTVQKTVLVVAAFAAAFGPVLAVIGTVRAALAPMIALVKVSGATAAAAGVATGGLSASLAVLRARIAGAATALGPYGLAIAGVTVVLAALTYATRDTAASLEDLESAAAKADARLADAKKQAQAAGVQIKTLDSTTGSATGSFSALTGAMWKSVEAMTAIAKNAKIAALATIELENAIARQTKSKLEPRLNILDAAASRNRRFSALFGQNVSGSQDLSDSVRAQLDVDRARVKAADSILARNKETAAIIKSLPNYAPAEAPSNTPVTLPGTTGDKKDKKAPKGRKEASGRSAAEIEQQFQDELANYAQQTLSARQRLAMSAEESAELEMRGVELARVRTIESINADKDYSKAQKQRLIDAVENLAEFERAGIEFQKQLSLERDATELAQISFDSQRDQLSNQFDLADTQADRKRIALEILELEQRYQRSKLQAVIDSETAGEAEKLRAQAMLASLAAIQASDRARVARANETQLESFMREGDRSPDQLGEAVTGVGLDGLNRLSDGLANIVADVRSVNDAFTMMRDVFQSAIQDMIAALVRLGIQKAIVGLIGGLTGGGGGGLPGTAGGMDLRGFSIPGFAGGTNFAPGGISLVGERGPELVNLPRGSQVIPNHELSSMGGGGSRNVTIQMSGNFMDERSMRTSASQMARRLRIELNGPIRT